MHTIKEKTKPVKTLKKSKWRKGLHSYIYRVSLLNNGEAKEKLMINPWP